MRSHLESRISTSHRFGRKKMHLLLAVGVTALLGTHARSLSAQGEFDLEYVGDGKGGVPFGFNQRESGAGGPPSGSTNALGACMQSNAQLQVLVQELQREVERLKQLVGNCTQDCRCDSNLDSGPGKMRDSIQPDHAAHAASDTAIDAGVVCLPVDTPCSGLVLGPPALAGGNSNEVVISLLIQGAVPTFMYHVKVELYHRGAPEDTVLHKEFLVGDTSERYEISVTFPLHLGHNSVRLSADELHYSVGVWDAHAGLSAEEALVARVLSRHLVEFVAADSPGHWLVFVGRLCLHL